MTYNSFVFLLVFLPLSIIAYQLSPRKLRSKTLLLFSLVFYFLLSQRLIVYLILISLTTYLGALLIEKSENKKYKQSILLVAILIPLGMLLWFKYYNFFTQNLNILFNKSIFPFKKLIQPMGISFFTLQAISYLVDVKNEKIQSEKNPLNILLFLSFFPTMIEGPIARYDQVMPALKEQAPIRYENLTFGLQRVLWGLIKKMVIADRIDPFVMTVFGHVDTYPGAILLSGILLYTLQLYAEFSGTMDIVIGVAQIFNVTLPENFNQPFLSKTVSEFWRRWHMTLGAFFKDYIFYPLSLSKKTRKLSKKVKPILGKYYARLIPSLIALFAVWLANGLWHGAQWQYILYGMYYFILISLGMLFEPLIVKVFAKLKIERDHKSLNILRWLRTFVLVNIGMLIFRSQGVRNAGLMLQRIFTDFQFTSLFDGTILGKGLDLYDFQLLLFGLILMIVVGILKEKGVALRAKIASWRLPLRFAFYYSALLFLIIFGAYGFGYAIVELIYANF